MTNAPAGWYPDTEQPGNERWWDGTQWSDHRRPSGPPAATTPTPADTVAQPTLSQPTVPVAQVASAAPAVTQKPLWKRGWFIAVAAVAALIVVGSVSGAIAAGKKPDTQAVAATTPIASASPTPTATAAPPTPTEAPAAAETPAAAAPVDPTYFKSNANKQLDDYAKDLTDLSDAVAKGSTLRVMSNSVELAFNEGELAGIAPTANVSVEWSTALAGLSITTTQIADAIGKQDYTTVNNLVAQATQKVASLRDIVNRAA